MADDPTTVEFEVDGKTYKARLCLWGFMLAMEKQEALDGVPQTKDEAEKKMEEMKEGNAASKMNPFKEFVETIWTAMLPFDETLQKRDVGMMLSMSKASEVYGKIVGRQIDEDATEKVKEAKQAKKKEVPA